MGKWTIYFFCLTLVLTVFLSVVFLFLGVVVSKKSTLDRELQSPFECGFSTYSDFRLKFSLHFFLVALVFIIFDVELIILFPYFISLSASTSFLSVVLFTLLLLALTLGLFNEWNQMILEWMK